MLFCSWIYILFLLITVVLYWRLPERFRIPMILLASYVFYMSWSPPHGLIYGPFIFLDTLYFYLLSLAMTRWPAWKKPILIVGVTSELCVLAYFKYAEFLLQSVNGVADWMGLPLIEGRFEIMLPLAISFTNFILISYLIDVYRGNEKPDPSFVRFAAYVAFFPHLIAGPIVRASELLHQFERRVSFSWESIVRGVHKFMFGLGVKLVVADVMAVYVNTAFSHPESQTFFSSWIATYGFAIQIFCDFFAYTAMAQGSALMMGFTLPDNFDSPYLSRNITDFWRRWHMTLSRWLRDYLYIPLGGSRCCRVRTYFNLFVTMGLGGLWHGASWTFVIWGLYQGLLLSLHKFAVHFKLNRLAPGVLAVFLTFHLVCIGWVFFRAETFNDALLMLSAMFSPLLQGGKGLEFTLTEEFAYSIMIITLFWVFHPLGKYFIRIARNALLAARQNVVSPAFAPVGVMAQGVGYFALFYLLVTTAMTKSEFIYFQF